MHIKFNSENRNRKGQFGRPRNRQEADIITGFEEVWYEDAEWIEQTQGKV
jgi:hypothetical protein